jgi:hypothetical protein
MIKNTLSPKQRLLIVKDDNKYLLSPKHLLLIVKNDNKYIIAKTASFNR